jgi:patatin-like phospholipase/acyl hydrolase
MPDLLKVLSLDGGGIRGILPALVLAEMERRTGRPIARLFDLIAGTSTGGILTLALTRPGPRGWPKYTAARLVQLYEQEGARIFSRSIWHRLHAVGNLFEEKYPSTGLQTVLRAYLGRTRLKDALTEVLVTAYEIEGRFPWFFKRHRARSDTATHDFPMVDVAQAAAAAAPTYFEPVKVRTREGLDEYALIDGGVYANNPAMCAYVEAQTLHPGAREFLVVSLGTGELTRPLPYEQVKGWGLANWAQPILNVVLDGVSDTTDYQLRQLLPSDRYFRFQTRLDEGNEDMDNASRTNLAALKRLGEALIRREEARLAELCERLS